MKLLVIFGISGLIAFQTLAAHSHTPKEECKEGTAHNHKTEKKGQKFKQEERFPADYFLIHKNMPHYMQVFNTFENDTALALSKEQKQEINALREKVVIKVAELAHKIKSLEEALKKRVVFEDVAAAELKPFVSEIANLRAELTLSHIECIQKTRALLTKEQHQFFLDKLEIKM